MKNTLKIALVMLAALFVIPLSAGDSSVPKTLPEEVYAQMKKGKALDQVWIAPGVTLTPNFSLKAVDYKAEEFRANLKESLTKTLTIMGKDKAPFQVEVTVVEVTNYKVGLMWVTNGKMVVEGRILNAEDGKLVMAFRTSTRVDEGLNGPEYVTASEIFASALVKELKATR